MGNCTWGRLIAGIVLPAMAVASIAGADRAVAAPRSGPERLSGLMAIPTAATRQPLGEVPPGPCPRQGSQACQGVPVSLRSLAQNIRAGDYPLDVPGLGIPVGGVGAGSFMINQDGTFGPWDFGGSQDSTWEMRILPQAAFHFREQIGSAPPTIRTLATDGPNVVGAHGPVRQRSWGSPLPAWHSLRPGQGTYSALYPFGWITYKPFATDVSMMFYSPIVAGADDPTSLPVVYFDIRLANRTGKDDSVAVMFTMPNAPIHLSGSPASVRKGFASGFERDPRTGVEAVTLSADSARNTPDTAHSEWTIAAKPSSGQHVSYTTSWDAKADGSDVYRPFVQSGRLPDKPLDGSASAGAIVVSARLRPGEATTIHFALSWDFPQVGFDDNRTIWMRRYADFYGARETSRNRYIPGSYPFHQSFRIADDALAEQEANLAAVRRWWAPIAYNRSYPTFLRAAALNQLYQIVFNSAFWEGGLVSNEVPPTGGARLGTSIPDTHVFNTADSTAAWSTDSSFAPVNNANEMDVDTYGYLAYDLLFPNLERGRMAALAQAIMADSNGYPGHNPLYVVSGNPLVTWTESAKPAPGAARFIDIPSKNILRLYAYARLAHADRFLRYAYPAMVRSLDYLRNTIQPGTYLPRSAPVFANTYDVIPVKGYDVYDCELYLLSLEIVIDTGERLGRPAASLSALKRDLSRAKSEFEQLFWDPVHHVYRYTPGPTPTADTVMLDTFFAENVAEQLRLPDLIDPQRMKEQLTDEYAPFLSKVDARGRLLGAPNMILPAGVKTWPDVGPFGLAEEPEVWSGTNYEVASTYYNAGVRFRDPLLEREGMDMARAIADQIWEVPGNGFAFDPPEAWNEDTTDLYRYPNYARAMSVWDLIEAIGHPGFAILANSPAQPMSARGYLHCAGRRPQPFDHAAENHRYHRDAQVAVVQHPGCARARLRRLGRLRHRQP